MNISTDRKIISASKKLIAAFDKYFGELFWEDVRGEARGGDPICISLIELHDAVKGIN